MSAATRSGGKHQGGRSQGGPESLLIDRLIEEGGEPSPHLRLAASSGRLRQLITNVGLNTLERRCARQSQESIEEIRTAIAEEADMACGFVLHFHDVDADESMSETQTPHVWGAQVQEARSIASRGRVLLLGGHAGTRRR